MLRALIPVLLLSPLLAASALAQNEGQSLDQSLRQALAEEAAANAQTAKLEQEVSRARGKADVLRARQAAAVEAIGAAEARITADDAQLRLASAYVAMHRRQLAAEQQPVSLLLAGLATMVRRPPLLAFVDRGGTDELVKVRLLLDSTLPIIRRRTSRVSAELAEGERLQRAVIVARSELAASQKLLLARRERYAQLERSAVADVLESSGKALGTSDEAIAAGENIERLRAEEHGSQSIRRVAELLARGEPDPASPFKPEGSAPILPFGYQLPASAPLIEGLGAVNDSGVLARGITLATSRGMPIVAPADGTIKFSGPYRDFDGVLIIDHGQGWLSVIVNAASARRPGERVIQGEEVGRALGPSQVELSHNEQRISPALIAGSSGNLSKGPKGR